jgi:hypothetical protein
MTASHDQTDVAIYNFIADQHRLHSGGLGFSYGRKDKSTPVLQR